MSDKTPAKRWQRIKRILNEALKRDQSEIQAYISEQCGDDQGMEREVYSLLEAYADQGIIDRPPARLFESSVTSKTSQSIIGTKIGAYRIEEKIAQGGMGEVYRAKRVDGVFEQQVALKVLAAGLFSDDQYRRFCIERQILASLNHDNIARLYDGGLTESGLPYFAMEFIEGKPIDQYCNENDMTVQDRMRLVITVCEAVQYAHRNLVIHRDLKPSNILVTHNGVVKLLDFGIARMMEPDRYSEPITRPGLLPLSPSYASPEQIREDYISTASDIYQLGVVLYELLTGILPHDVVSKSAATIEKIICEDNPARPSTAVRKSYSEENQPIITESSDRGSWVKALRGDPDTIILKAMAKEPENRYGSAAEMASDIRRYVSGKPVLAHPQSIGYRSRKFIKRHRWAATVSMLFVVMLTAYAITVTTHSKRTHAALEKAEQESEKSVQVIDFMMGMFEAGDPAQALGDTITARVLLDRGMNQAEKLDGQPEVQATMFDVVGRVYRSLGEYEQAEPIFKEVLAIRENLHDKPALPMAKSHYNLAGVMHDAGKYGQAHQHYQKAADIFLQLPDHESEAYADVLHNISAARQDYDGIEKSLQMRRNLFESNHPKIAQSYAQLGIMYLYDDQPDSAELHFNKARAVLDRIEDHQSPEVAGVMGSLASGLKELKLYDDALKYAERNFEILQSIYTEGHTNVAIAAKVLADVHSAKGQFSTANRYYEQALAELDAAAGEEHPLRRPVLQGWGEHYYQAGEYGQAEPLFREALGFLKANLRPDHPRIASMSKKLGACLLETGNYPEAEEMFEKSLAIYQQHDSESAQNRKKGVLRELSRLNQMWGREEQMLYYDEKLAGMN